jgi:RNA polymerase sigma-70 factor (ECF subfamily)
VYTVNEVSLTPTTLNIEQVFEQVFKSHFKQLHAYALTILREDEVAEEITQNVFYKLWNKKDVIDITSSVTAYLYKTVYNDCLNHLKHQKVRKAHSKYVHYFGEQSANNISSSIQLTELQQRINEALNALPEQCRTIFQMSRFEELTYKEIAEQLGLSVKTIENQMGKALRIMRAELADYLPSILFLLLNFI